MTSATSSSTKYSYPLIMRERNGSFILACPTLRLILEGQSLDVLYSQMQVSIAELLERHERAGLSPPQPGGGEGDLRGESTGLRPTRRRWLFLPVVMAVVFVGMVAVVAPAAQFIGEVQSRVREAAAQMAEPRLWSNRLIQLAEVLEQITPEREQELLQAIDRIVLALEPYADRLRPLYSDPGASLEPSGSAEETLPAP
ncbi:MAG: hypothetical protein RIE31_11175 [Alphaproteobacteria bacterium]